MAKNLVIVESPTKAKIITTFLWKDFKVMSSNGHIRDLPAKKWDMSPKQAELPYATLAVDIEWDLDMIFVNTPAKKKIIANMKAQIEPDTILRIASDEDREWEAIWWHLLEALDPKRKLKNKRVVFHEITKWAIQEAFKATRELDMDLVEAQMARRVLDRVVWYKLSPLLWKKIKFWLSAWRVQTPCTRILVEREREIDAFIPEEYWSVWWLFNKDKISFESKFFTDVEIMKDWKKLELKSSEDTAKILEKIWTKFVEKNWEIIIDEKIWENLEFKVEKIVKKTQKRNPPVPFITSTLQQEASRKLWFSVKQTMMVAQKLYEWKELKKWELSWLITYMRTDSTNLSETALKQSKIVLEKMYWKDYCLDTPRTFSKKAKWAQEAHEAVRPTDLSRTPASLKWVLTDEEWRLYDLIWKRTLATQSTQAIFDWMAVDLVSNWVMFRANWSTLKFPWYLKIYTEWSDNPEEVLDWKDKILPNLEEWEILKTEQIIPEQHFTRPPARYTEASLVKKMEEEWIWRPSTYAPTITTLQARWYATKEWRNIIPTDVAFIVVDFLVAHFENISDLKFTSKMEEELDTIAEWKQKWKPWMKNFWGDFEKLLWNKEEIERSEVNKERELWKCPKTWRPVFAKFWRFWAMVMIWTKDDEEKPAFASIPAKYKLETINYEEAMHLFKLPRSIWKIWWEDVMANNWPYWPYVKVWEVFIPIKEFDPFEVKLEEIEEMVKEYLIREKDKYIQRFTKEKIDIINWPYWPYIKKWRSNHKIAKSITVDELKKMDIKQVQDLIANPPARNYWRKKAEVKDGEKKVVKKVVKKKTVKKTVKKTAEKK